MDLPAKALFDWLKYQGFDPWLAVRNKGLNPDWLDYEGFRVLSPND
jgi:hypothetical protein